MHGAPGAAPHNPAMRVLVLEDDPRIAEALVAHLGLQGHAVDTAATLAAGWALLCAEPVDLLLLDLGLPDGDGAGLLARLRAALAPRRAADCLAMADAHVLSDIGFVRTPEAPRAQLAG